MAWVDWGQGDLPDSSVVVDKEPAVVEENREKDEDEKEDRRGRKVGTGKEMVERDMRIAENSRIV